MKSRSKSTESATYREIVTQTEAWREACTVTGARAAQLGALWEEGRYARTVFTGCGSTYYLALAAAALFQDLTGSPARGVPAGELVMYPSTAYASAGRTLLVAISRSSETTETVRAVSGFQEQQRGEVVVVTNYGERSLAKMGAMTIAIPAGQEESIAQTRSFASMYVATAAIAAALAGREDLVQEMHRLPEAGQAVIQRYEALAQSLGSDLGLDRIYFLGSGPRYGLACEANLKMKEMSLTHSEPFHFLEFRHGPMSMVGPTALVTGLVSEVSRTYEEAVLQDMRQLGGRTLSLGEHGTEVAFGSGLPEPIRSVLYLPVLQLMAYYRALAKGLNPDQPHNLNAVVKLG